MGSRPVAPLIRQRLEGCASLRNGIEDIEQVAGVPRNAIQSRHNNRVICLQNLENSRGARIEHLLRLWAIRFCAGYLLGKQPNHTSSLKGFIVVFHALSVG
jgi:hypothetical protein